MLAVALFALSNLTVPIIVAVVTVSGTIVVAALQSFRKENRIDHEANQRILLQIDDKIDHVQERIEDRITLVEQKIDGHLDFHIRQERRDRDAR